MVELCLRMKFDGNSKDERTMFEKDGSGSSQRMGGLSLRRKFDGNSKDGRTMFEKDGSMWKSKNGRVEWWTVGAPAGYCCCSSFLPHLTPPPPLLLQTTNPTPTPTTPNTHPLLQSSIPTLFQTHTHSPGAHNHQHTHSQTPHKQAP